MQNMFWVGFAGFVLAVFFAYLQRNRVTSYLEGTEEMRRIAASIREDAGAYLKHQYSTVAKASVVAFLVLLAMAFDTNGQMSSKFILFASLTGDIQPMLAGSIGMKTVINANAYTARAASESLNKGLCVTFSPGSVMGFTIVGLGILDVFIWFRLLYYGFGIMDATQLDNTMVMNGMGASFMALLIRVGDGIYTKAAGVGADLVGKVEAGIPENDPRSPATIADDVGDNVGDVAGVDTDLYESYVGFTLTMFMLVAAAGYDFEGMLLPILLAACEIICSIIDPSFVKTKEDATQKSLLTSPHTGTCLAAGLSAIVTAPLIYCTVGNWGIYVAVLCSLISGCVVGYFTEYYTSDIYKPTQELATSSGTGSATVIIGGLSSGMRSTAASIIIVVIVVIINFFTANGAVSYNMDPYGIDTSAVGMLSTLGVTLATDAYGPVADNADGIAEMAGLPKQVRERTDALDSLGNITATVGKGLAIGSASLTALASLVSYADIVTGKGFTMNLSLTSPMVLVGLFIGAMLAFVLSVFTTSVVQVAAQPVVMEVCRQFKEIAGIMEGRAGPGCAACVSFCTKGALREVVASAPLVITVPIAIGLVLGAEDVVGLFGGVSMTGPAMAVFMSNTGDVWDNAKEYIEAGHHGGKGSDCHKAAAVGDTVSDPSKDTFGPPLNILIKLYFTVSTMFSGLILSPNLLGLM